MTARELFRNGLFLAQILVAAPGWSEAMYEDLAVEILATASKPEYRNSYPRGKILEAGEYLYRGCGDACLVAYLHAFNPEFPRERQFLDKALLAYAKEVPYYVLNHMERFPQLPSASKIIRIAAENSAKDAVHHFKLYRGKKYADSLLKASVFKLADKNPETALELADRYSACPYAEEIIRKAATKQPGAALRYSNHYRDRPFAKSVMEHALAMAPQMDPEYFLDSGHKADETEKRQG